MVVLGIKLGPELKRPECLVSAFYQYITTQV